MAIVKHIKSRNANYSDALNYLIFQHDESTGKMILDEFNRPLRRDELYVNGLNCNPDTFDVECYECNEHFKKNRSRSEIKSHHYIISFDPDDKSECGLTGEKSTGSIFRTCKENLSRISGSYCDTYRWSQWFRQYPYAHCDQQRP